MRRLWERLLAENRSVTRRTLVSAACALLGFGLAFDLFRSTGFYFTFVIIVTVIVIALYAGGALAVGFAVMLSLAADYEFIPPVGHVLNSRAGLEHFAIIVSTAVTVAFAASSVRSAFREAMEAKREAETATRAAEDASSAMEQILALVAHDVRNPLATAKMELLVLVDPGSNEQSREGRAMMLRNLEQADSMIQSLLDVASIRAGRTLPIERHACDLSEELRRMVAALGARDRIDLETDGPIRGEWGTAGLLRALQNLVANALKYGTPGSRVGVRLRRDGDTVLLCVHNDGPPIREEDQREIFRPFRRTTESVASGRRGWGLGLAIVQAVAEAHGGHASVESTEASGTTFTLAMPLRAREAAQRPAAKCSLQPRSTS